MKNIKYDKTILFITGSSRGIGKAIAECFLEAGTKVVGLSRSSTIEHPNYTHIVIDLSKLEEVRGFDFQANSDIENCILINNAGTLGDVKPFFKIAEETIIDTINLNFIAPLILTHKLMALQSNHLNKKYVLNIGTGAASRAMDGWSLYCSSKAGLQMFDEVLKLENQIHSKEIKNINLRPGIIDTRMQEEIRGVEKGNFSLKQMFVEYFENGDLQSAQQTANIIFRNFNFLFHQKKATLSINDLT